MAYANPDAPTQIANGISTSTFSYDNNGNLTQKTVDGTTTTYVYDYANRLTALGVSGATTTYGYEASGVATGTAKTRYIHPDHLGSTNVVTDENDNVVQTLDYYPYGATRISTTTPLSPAGTIPWSNINLSQDQTGSDGGTSNGKAAPNTADLSGKIQKQMQQRGWTQEQIQEAIQNGQQIPAANKANDNPATRYINPKTGQSVVVDDVTGEIIHVGGPGFKYGPSSGDVVK